MHGIFAGIVALSLAGAAPEDASVLQQLIDKAPHGSTLDLTGRTFLTGMDTIRVDHKKNFTIVGGTVIRKKDFARYPENGKKLKGSGRIWNFKLCDHLTLRNMTVIGPKRPQAGYQVPREGHHAFGFAACSNVVCENLKVQHVLGDGMYFGSVGGAWNSTPCTNVTVTGFMLDDCGRHGIALTAIDGFTIKDSVLQGYQRKAIDREDRVKADTRKNIVIEPTTIKKPAKQIRKEAEGGSGAPKKPAPKKVD
jgi:hypothetical protein